MSAKAAAKALQRTSSQLGRYRLIAPIASGGMAGVHLARIDGQGGFSRLVAIKVLHHHLTEDRDFVAMFLDEARLAARVRNPNVVDVYDVETFDDELCIVMQYVEGAALSVLLREAKKRAQPFPTGVLLRAMFDALRGLHAAHELCDESGELLGLVHRDMSPQNVLVGVDGVGRVTDFGVAKARGRMVSTQGAAVKGKTRYLAPEQVRGKPLDRRVDVFAAGIVLWEGLTGRGLFQGGSEADTMMAILSHPIPPPSQYEPSIPLALDRICLKALERDPELRHPSAAALADEIEDAVGHLFVKTREVGELVEILHSEELARLRTATKRGPEETPASEQVSGLAPPPSHPTAPARSDATADPETRSALPITKKSGISTRKPRRAGWIALAASLTAGALAIGYYMGRDSSVNESPAAESTLAPAMSAPSPNVESKLPARVDPSASATAPAITKPAPVSKSRRAPVKTTKPSTSSKSGVPFMPGAL